MSFSGLPTDIIIIHNGITYKGKYPPNQNSTLTLNLDSIFKTNDGTSPIIWTAMNVSSPDPLGSGNFDRLYDLIGKPSCGDSYLSTIRELNRIFKHSILSGKSFERLVTKMMSYEDLEVLDCIRNCLSVKNYDLATKLLAHKSLHVNDIFPYILQSSILDNQEIPDEFKNTLLFHVDPLGCCSIMKEQGLYSKYACNYFKKNVTLGVLMKIDEIKYVELMHTFQEIAKK